MPTSIFKPDPDAAASSPLAMVAGVRRRQVPADGVSTLDLDGRVALIFVEFGVLAIGGRSGARALPGEWVRASGMAALEYANASRTEELRTLEAVFTGCGSLVGGEVAQRYFSDDEKANQLCTVAAPASSKGALALGLDAAVHVVTLGRWSTVLHDLAPGRAAWVVVVTGNATVNNEKLESGGSAFIVDEDEVRISGVDGADVLLLEAARPPAAGDGAKITPRGAHGNDG